MRNKISRHLTRYLAGTVVGLSLLAPVASHAGEPHECSATANATAAGIQAPSCSFTVKCHVAAGGPCSWNVDGSVSAQQAVMVSGTATGSQAPTAITSCTATATSCSMPAAQITLQPGTDDTITCTGGGIALSEAITCKARTS